MNPGRTVTKAPATADPATGRPPRRWPGADLAVAALTGVLVAAAVVGAVVSAAAGRPVYADAAPLFGQWLPHVGPGTLPALAVAVVVIRVGARLAERLPWRPLMILGYLAALAWSLSLALVDGWQRGLAGRLATRPEYLRTVPEVTDIGAMLRGFTGRILLHQSDSWPTHIAGHPPGALLNFVLLDRIGLGGPAVAALACVAAGAAIAVAVPVTVRALVSEPAARASVPFLVLLPGAVWLGVSADAVTAGVATSGLALLAVGSTARRPAHRTGALVAAGAVLGYCLYLSYGMVLLAPIGLAVALLAHRRAAGPTGPVGTAGPGMVDSRAGWQAVLTRLGWVLAGAGAVVATFTVAGFWWLDGYQLVVERYYQGIATQRPYSYWVWANLACVGLSAGPAMAVVLRRAAVVLRRAVALTRGTTAVWLSPDGRDRWRIAVLPIAALTAMLVADATGLSKAEVERIWLPFLVWLPAGAALLPDRHRRGWLALQAAVALAVNHLVLTNW